MAISVRANASPSRRRDEITPTTSIHPSQQHLIFDKVEDRSLADCRRALRPEGLLILNSGTGTRGVATLVPLAVISPFVRQTLRRYMSAPKHEDLAELARMVDAGSHAGDRRDLFGGGGPGRARTHRERARAWQGRRQLV